MSKTGTTLGQLAADLAADLGQAGRYMAQGLRLMVGQPDYGSYLRHMAATHPDQAPMNFEEFFRNRQDARFGVGTGRMTRCC